MASKRDRLVGRGGLTEEIDKKPALAGVLVGQKGQCAIVRQHFDHLVEAAGLGHQRLPCSLAEVAKIAIEIGVVECAGDRNRGEAEHSKKEAGKLPVAVVAGQDDERATTADQVVHQRGKAGQLDRASPVLEMELAGGVQDLHEHHAKVAIHSAHDLVALGGGELVAESLSQIVDSHLTVARIDLVNDPSEQPRQRIRLLDRQHLGEGDHEPDCQVSEIVQPELGLLRPGHSHSVDSKTRRTNCGRFVMVLQRSYSHF